MKKYKYNVIFIYIYIALISLLTGVVCFYPIDNELFYVIYLTTIILYIPIVYQLWRCPHCGKSFVFILKINPFMSHCPYCGEKLN